jgi:predicted ribosome quality control (RQC) complex YloA/Tae2 family protein
MYDLLTTAAIADELSGTIAGGRIQRAGLRDRNTVVLEIYAQHARHWLVATIAGREPVCYLTGQEVGIDASVITPFSLLLRKYLRGGTLVAIEQPGLDRILRLSVSKTILGKRHADSLDPGNADGGPDDEDSNDETLLDDLDVVFTSLNIEVMGRRSNIILVADNGEILDSIKRVTPDMSRVRPILPHTRYTLPPPGDRLDPRTISARQIETIIAACDPDQRISGALVSSLSALSPQMGRDVVFRVMGDTEVQCKDLGPHKAEAIAEATHWLFSHLEQSEWNPVLYLDESGEIAAYSAVPLQSLDDQLTRRDAVSMSDAVQRSSAQDMQAGRHAARRDRVAQQIEQERARVAARLANLEQQERELADVERYRRWGEAIYANLWSIEPGQSELSAEGEVIPLDPALQPKEQAQAYFSRYRKAGRGAEQIEQAIGATRNELAYLDQLQTLVGLSESFDEIEALRREWLSTRAPTDSGRHRGDKQKPPKRAVAPKPLVDQFGNRIYVGRTGPQNDLVTFDLAGPDDYWLHARGVPGAHVILRPGTVNPDALEQALGRSAQLAAYYSASRADSTVSVDICKRRDVRKIKGAGPGLVTYRNERTVNVKPAPLE